MRYTEHEVNDAYCDWMDAYSGYVDTEGADIDQLVDESVEAFSDKWHSPSGGDAFIPFQAGWDAAFASRERVLPTNPDEEALIEQVADEWVASLQESAYAPDRWSYIQGWKAGFLLATQADNDMENAYRGAVTFAWGRMHDARRATEAARARGEGTLRPQREEDACEIALRTLLLVRKMARSGWAGE